VPTVQVNGRRLGYVRRGSGEPLLLIPGMAMHGGIWDEPLLSALETDFDIVAMDHRGVGDSDDVPGEFSIVDLADDVAALLDAIGWQSAHVLGFSLGGMVAQEFVVRHPERVRTLILAGTYAGGEGSDLNAPGPMAMLQSMGTGNIETALRAAFTANLSTTYTANDAHYDNFKRVSMSGRLQVPTIVAQARAAFFHNARDRLAEIDVPTLVLHGTDDQMILCANGELLASLIPGARLHTFDGVGHMFWWERLDETVQLIREHCLGSRAAA
jgi:pimeloyl-ACP methyl ester carboxylesterase